MLNKAERRPDKKHTAACGLFCPACSLFIGTKEDPQRLEMLAKVFGVTSEQVRCEGCRSNVLSPYCRTCKMVKCCAEKGIEFCGECVEYPCAELKNFQEAMPHRIELWEALARIKAVGYANWYMEMIEHYSCQSCGTINSAYDFKCRKCGAEPSCEYVKLHREEIIGQMSKLQGKVK